MRLTYQGAAMTYRIEPIGIGPTNGTLTIYSAPKAVLRHVEWTIFSRLGVPTQINWKVQPLEPSTMWASIHWRASLGTSSALASELVGWHYLRFELHEAAANGINGSLFMYVPDFGLFRGDVGAHGDLMITEHQINSILREEHREADIVTELERILGKKWDEELECYRRAIADGSEVHLDRLSV